MALGIKRRLAFGIVPRKAKTAEPITSTPTIGLYVVIVCGNVACVIDEVDGPLQSDHWKDSDSPPNKVMVKFNPHHDRKTLTSESAPASKATKLILGNEAAGFAVMVDDDVGCRFNVFYVHDN